MKRSNRKVSKIERTAEKKRIIEHRQHGEGAQTVDVWTVSECILSIAHA